MAQRLVERASPGHRVLDLEPLTNGFRNSNFKLQLDWLIEPVVLRIYEHTWRGLASMN